MNVTLHASLLLCSFIFMGCKSKPPEMNVETLTVVPDWGTVHGHDHDHGIGSTHGGVVVDQAGLVYVSSSEGIFVYNDQGVLQKKIAGPAYSNIHAMTLLDEGGTEYIYAARNAAAEAIKLKTDGTIVMNLPFPEASGAKVKKYNPTAVAVKPNGNILVADGYGSNLIFEYDAEGTYLSRFGGKDEADIKKFKTPHGLTIDTRYEPARLLFCDREKRRLVHFDLEGEFMAEVITGLRRPCAASISGEYVAVAELEGRVVVLNGANEIVVTLGENPDKTQWANFKVATSDWNEGVFTAPHGISWDAHGNLYVQDWNQSGRISKWTPDVQ